MGDIPVGHGLDGRCHVLLLLLRGSVEAGSRPFAFVLLHLCRRAAAAETSLINKGPFIGELQIPMTSGMGSAFSPWLEQNKVFSGDGKEEGLCTK